MRGVLLMLGLLGPTIARDVVRRRGRKVARVPEDLSHWQQLAGFHIAESSIPVVKYRSNLTGLTVAVARGETPIVNGYFCLPTEAHDNDGLPHTLEHLIFMGSEDYPYKEVASLPLPSLPDTGSGPVGKPVPRQTDQRLDCGGPHLLYGP